MRANETLIASVDSVRQDRSMYYCVQQHHACRLALHYGLCHTIHRTTCYQSEMSDSARLHDFHLPVLQGRTHMRTREFPAKADANTVLYSNDE